MDYMMMLKQLMAAKQAAGGEQGGQQSGPLAGMNAGGSLINTNAKDAGGYTDPASAGMDGAQKGFQAGGPVGAAIGAGVGLATAFKDRRTEHRNNQAKFETAGRQQAADSYDMFNKVIGGLR